MAVFCPSCGAALPGTARFCSSCGAVVPAAPFVEAKPLVRPIVGRKVAGVCIAISQAYGWDLALVRILTVVGLFCSGGLVAIAYLAGWIGIPEEQIAGPGSYPTNV